MNPPTHRPAVAVLLAISLTFLAAGCGSDDQRLAATGPAETEPPPPTTAGTVAPSTTATSVSSAGRTSTTRVTTTRPRVSTTATAKVTPPKVVAAQQGDRVFAVFVATGSSLGDPSFSKAKARLTSLGYRGYSGGDTDCSQGAKETLPQLEAYSLSLEFATRADADRFSALYGPVLGTAAVTVHCAD